MPLQLIMYGAAMGGVQSLRRTLVRCWCAGWTGELRRAGWPGLFIGAPVVIVPTFDSGLNVCNAHGLMSH